MTPGVPIHPRTQKQANFLYASTSALTPPSIRHHSAGLEFFFFFFFLKTLEPFFIYPDLYS